MGTQELRNRDNWQTNGGTKAGIAEYNFYHAFTRVFAGTEFVVEAKPKEFKHIYENVQLPPEVLQAIYQPDKKYEHGIEPDFALRNTKTSKTLYVEVKRQDGWVEGKLPSAGRGNAHERSCKFFTPGLLKILREYGKLGDNVLPFWVVFQGDITRDPKRVREITLWYEEKFADHFFMWREGTGDETLIQHFNEKLKRFLLD